MCLWVFDSTLAQQRGMLQVAACNKGICSNYEVFSIFVSQITCEIFLPRNSMSINRRYVYTCASKKALLFGFELEKKE